MKKADTNEDRKKRQTSDGLGSADTSLVGVTIDDANQAEKRRLENPEG